jgi:putative resolvase
MSTFLSVPAHILFIWTEPTRHASLPGWLAALSQHSVAGIERASFPRSEPPATSPTTLTTTTAKCLDENHANKTYAYLRVSSPTQKRDLANQHTAVEQFCIASGKEVGEYLEDVGSGLNYKRKHFLRLMEMVEHGEVSEIVIAHKDRLVRFGFEFFEKFCTDHGCRITVMNAESLSPEEEMVKDLLSIVHCFSSRPYGLRRYKKADIVAMVKS